VVFEVIFTIATIPTRIASGNLLVKPKVQDSERRRRKRALSDSELQALIETTRTALPWRGLSGFDRSLLYAIASMTGFRRGELMSLTPESFRLDATPPTIVCEAGYTKNGQLAEQPIPDPLASVLRPWLATKRQRHPVFDRMTAWTVLMLRHDLERCGIPFKDESGRVVDLHALRHTYITALGKAGLPIKVH
jgi:integrase